MRVLGGSAYNAMAECAGTVASTLPPLTVTVLEQSMVAYTLQYSPSARDVAYDASLSFLPLLMAMKPLLPREKAMLSPPSSCQSVTSVPLT